MRVQQLFGHRYRQHNPMLRLHQEICDFAVLMEPTETERQQYERVEMQLHEAVVRCSFVRGSMGTATMKFFCIGSRESFLRTALCTFNFERAIID